MTDEQIEIALKHCEDTGDYELCKTCPYADSPLCTLHDDALDYINRLKAENERLKQSDISKEICTIEQHAEIHKLRDELKQVRKDTAKDILQIVREVQRGVGGNHYVYPDSVIASEIIAKYDIKE